MYSLCQVFIVIEREQVTVYSMPERRQFCSTQTSCLTLRSCLKNINVCEKEGLILNLMAWILSGQKYPSVALDSGSATQPLEKCMFCFYCLVLFHICFPCVTSWQNFTLIYSPIYLLVYLLVTRANRKNECSSQGHR